MLRLAIESSYSMSLVRNLAQARRAKWRCTLHSPLFYFRGYYRDPEHTAERFVGEGRYCLSGDAGSRDADDYFYFSARADDVIKSAGYRIGPFDVENALLAHEAVAEAAVVGKPDSLKGNVVKAFVVLKPGRTGSETLAKELSQLCEVTPRGTCISARN